ncbi:ComF family protein [Aneurinibacillus thermoaerophilus]|uniref:ComF family protein n=1 Tax=Aneurinibacillus thermoaerophilus TaxID=143495 RepID=UPI002E1E9A0A|nr:ComF family protein [Aneurinibacillus thermoaerophilus]MED0763317.1 ComF family protein [Aneurinibacillus thermoaerophilus]
MNLLHWKRWTGWLLDILYPPPPRCTLCGNPKRGEAAVKPGAGKGGLTFCSVCESQFVFLTDTICPICGRAWPTNEPCPDCCRRKSRHFCYSRSAVRYNKPMKELLARYKYRGDRRLAEMMVELLWRAWYLYYREMKIDAITYIPLHEKRLMERTFNQAEEMARFLGQRIGLPVYGLLERRKETEKQSQKKRAARLHALENAFYFSDAQAVNSFEVQALLLLDDVYTTGSSLNAAARALKEGIPGAEVYGLTVAR